MPILGLWIYRSTSYCKFKLLNHFPIENCNIDFIAKILICNYIAAGLIILL